jgi:NADPH:quinone reductase-like Zn-dependent oxidoreductase
MKAAVYREYGPPEVVRIEEVPTPAPKDDELLVRVHASTISAPDWRFRKPDPSFVMRLMNGWSRPKKINILGLEFAGRVESVGRKVTRFSVDDRIFGSAGFKFGAHAEYLSVAEDALVSTTPANLADEEVATLLFGGVSALHFLWKGGIASGQRVLIYGASGSVGAAAVQLAKHFGAHVTGVCSGRNIDLVKSLGADEVIDYAHEDFSRAGRVYDIVFETVGKASFWKGAKVLKRGGSYLLAASLIGSAFGSLWGSATGAGRVIGGVAKSQPGDIDFLKDLLARGQIKAVIDRRYLLAEIAEAHRYAQSGRKRGNVVVIIRREGEA